MCVNVSQQPLSGEINIQKFASPKLAIEASVSKQAI
jgi:hypothetical protein